MFYGTVRGWRGERGQTRVERSGPGWEGYPPGSPATFLLTGYGRGAASLAVALEADGHHVTTFSRYSSCLRESARTPPDSVLVGCDSSAGDPFSFLAELAETVPHTLSIALVPSRDPGWINEVLSAGADDVVTPPHAARSILLRRSVLRRTGRHGAAANVSGTAPLSRRVPLGPMTVDLNSRQVLDGRDPLTLSGREFELLVRLMQASGDVVHRDELIRDIWGEGQGSEAVLDATVHRLRRKLDEKLPDRDLVTTVRGVGYRLADVPDASPVG